MHSYSDSGKEEWPVSGLAASVRDFFEHSDYEVVAMHQDVPGKDLVTVEDDEQMTVTWEGGDEFGYVQDGEYHPLDQGDDLYSVASDLMEIYDHAAVLDDDLNTRYRSAAHANSPEFSDALNEPMEWGVANDARHWNDEKQGPLQKIKDLLGSS